MHPPRVSTPRRTRRCALVCACLQGCTSWHPVNTPLPELLATKPTVTLQLADRGGQRLILRQLQLDGDSLHGLVSGVPRAIALTDVTSVAVRRVNPAATIVLIGGLVLVVGGIVAMSTHVGGGSPLY